MLLVALLGFVAVLVCIGLGIALGFAALVLTAAFAGAGVVLNSTLYGMWRNSAASGLRAMLLQLGALSGAAVGGLAGLLFLGKIGVAAISGALAGALVAWMSWWLLGMFFGWLQGRRA